MSEDALSKGLQHLTSSGLATCHGEIPNAVYTFSHALVQDAAYDSLLKSRRKQLHGDIAHLLEERWPETRDAAPELLAYHYNSAEQFRVAAPLWLRAGEIAIQRFALPEAITHLRTGMSALSKLRPSKARDRMEISLRTALGPALVAHRGWAHAEVSQTLEPAWRLAQSLKQSYGLPADLERVVGALHDRGPIGESLRWADRLSKTGASSATMVWKSLVIAQPPPATTGSANSRQPAAPAIKHTDSTIRSDIGIWRRSPTPTPSPEKASIACNSYG